LPHHAPNPPFAGIRTEFRSAGNAACRKYRNTEIRISVFPILCFSVLDSLTDRSDEGREKAGISLQPQSEASSNLNLGTLCQTAPIADVIGRAARIVASCDYMAGESRRPQVTVNSIAQLIIAATDFDILTSSTQTVNSDNMVADPDQTETALLIEMRRRDMQDPVAGGLAAFETIKVEHVSGHRAGEFGGGGLDFAAMRRDYSDCAFCTMNDFNPIVEALGLVLLKMVIIPIGILFTHAPSWFPTEIQKHDFP
jgi:hypothetical protein